MIAAEPYRTFYWLAAETGLRAGELCGLRVSDVDLTRNLIHIEQTVWHGKLQTPKTENATRSFAISPPLVKQLCLLLTKWRPNENRLLFATRSGTPWDANLLVKRKLYPLLAALMDRLNVPLKVRQARLGHSDPRTTMGYYTNISSQDD